MKIRSLLVFGLVVCLGVPAQAECFRFGRKLDRPGRLLRVRSCMQSSMQTVQGVIVQPLAKVKKMVCDGQTCRME
jgi:hypothetical protein